MPRTGRNGRPPIQAALPELAARFRQLGPAGKWLVHRYLCANALVAWLRFTAATGAIDYVDSVIGMGHRLDWQLPADAFNLVFGHSAGEAGDASIGEIEYRYREPIVAFQDDDLELPDAMELGYYAIYNAFQKYALGRMIDDWLIVNQALSVAPEQPEWEALLSGALATAS